MSASTIIRRDGTPQTDRRIAVLDAVTKAAAREGRQVVLRLRLAMVDAALSTLGDRGELAPLAGERDKHLTDLLTEVEHRLDEKGMRVRG